jgi:hypothetical protein
MEEQVPHRRSTVLVVRRLINYVRDMQGQAMAVLCSASLADSVFQ